MSLTDLEKELQQFLQKHPKLLNYQNKINRILGRNSCAEQSQQIKSDTINIGSLNFKSYKFNEEALYKFWKELRDHQKESIISLQGQTIGQINIPTGTGKTRIQKYLHVKDMIQKTKQNKTGIYVIAAHRLVLCTQLFDRIIDLVIRSGLKVNFLYVGSEHYNFTKLNNKYKDYGFPDFKVDVKRTTSQKEILEIVELSRTKNRHLLIVSTYHSFDRLKILPKIDLCTFDEAHTTVNNKFHKNIKTVCDYTTINRKFFFTATRKVIGVVGGQNDKAFYGPVLYDMSVKEAIEKSEIVFPRIHKIDTIIDYNIKYDSEKRCEVSDQNNFRLLVRTILEAFVKHEHKVKEYSIDPDSIAAKLLITAEGLDDIQNLLYDIKDDNRVQSYFVDACVLKNIKIFSFSSKNKYHYINEDGKLKYCVSRREILEEMTSLKDTDRAIFFHYDILTEGIDLPAITGVLILRELSRLKLIQNIGRACRLLWRDRKKLYAGLIPTTNKEKFMVKPYSWIILPKHKNTGWTIAEDIIKFIRSVLHHAIEIDTDLTDTSNSSVPEELDSVIDDSKAKDGPDKRLEHEFEEDCLDETNLELLHIEDSDIEIDSGEQLEHSFEDINVDESSSEISHIENIDTEFESDSPTDELADEQNITEEEKNVLEILNSGYLRSQNKEQFLKDFLEEYM